MVLRPRRIIGSVRKGYHLLYQDKRVLKILAHPDPETDEWHRRLLPRAAGIEVVNGSVYLKARERELSVFSVLDIPMIRLFARYLSMGYPVAIVANSDAHRLA